MTTRPRKTAPAVSDDGPARYFARVVGIDFSLTSTGVAILYPPDNSSDTVRIRTVAYLTKVPNDAPLIDRYHRIRYMANAFPNLIGSADLILIEGPSHGSAGGHAWDRAGAWWAVVGMALDLGCPVVPVAPMTRAKWATGNGRSDKAAVAAAMTRRMPGVVFANSDESDGAALAYMGAQRLGWRPTTTQAERDVLAAVRWPKGVHP